MQKKIKINIPQNQKIKPEEAIPEEDTFESFIEENSVRTIYRSKNKNNTRRALKTISSIISVVVLIIVTTPLISNIAKNINIKTDETPKKEIKLNSNITGSWQSSTNGLFVFKEDNTFYWYNSYENLNDNYYKGTYNYKTGQDALNEMGFSEEEFKTEYGAEIKLENIYSINLQPHTVLKNKVDITTVELDESTTWWYLLIIKEDNTANGFNKTLDLKYNLIKKAE